jgi:hypothetical protein
MDLRLVFKLHADMKSVMERKAPFNLQDVQILELEIIPAAG